MSQSFSIRTVVAVAVLMGLAWMPAPAWSQHGHGGGHGGFGGHGVGGHGGGGHGFGGHYGGGHHGGGHYGGGHYGGGHGYGIHGGLHGYSHSGYGHHVYDHDNGLGHGGHAFGLHGYGHGDYLHGYGFHEYYPHSFYSHYPYYYDSYPYYGWYQSFGVSLYPWYGFYGVSDRDESVLVTRRPISAADVYEDEDQSLTAPDVRSTASRSTVTAQGREFQRRAEAAFRTGRFDEALRQANHALVEMPRDGKLLLFVSQSLFATGDYRGSAAAIHQAATLLDKDDWGHVVKSWRNYYRGSAYKDAMEKLHAYVKKHPETAYAHFLRGYHFGFLGNKEYARKELTKVINLEGRDRLAVELLKMFGGEPPSDAVDSGGKTNGPVTSPGENADEIQSDDHDHEHDDHDAAHNNDEEIEEA